LLLSNTAKPLNLFQEEVAQGKEYLKTRVPYSGFGIKAKLCGIVPAGVGHK